MTKFEALEVAVEMVAAVREPLQLVARHDASLADQARRAATSVALCLAEGRERQGRDRTHLFRVAAGSAEELRTALRLGTALGYLAPDATTAALALIDRVKALLWRLQKPRAA